MGLSQIASTIGESATLKLNATAAALRAEGKPVIHLGGGEPESKAPPSALRAAAALLETGAVRYTPASGLPALKEAIADYTREYYHIDVAPRNVVASGGAKQAIMVALHALLDPGDEVLFPVPYWVSYPDMVRLCAARPVPVKPADGSFHPTIEDIQRHTTSRTKIIILNTPNNPSGAVYTAEFIRAVVQLCEERNIYLLMDDIYQRLVFDGRRPVSAGEFVRRKGDDGILLIVNGVSKQYAMTGFRLGWAVGPAPLIRVMGMIQGHETSGPSALSQHAAIGALRGEQSSVEELRRTLEQNRNLLLDCLATLPHVRVERPGGTFYSLVDFRHYDTSSNRLAQHLLEQSLVITVPGVEFGLDGFLRISYCGAAHDIRTGVERIKTALAGYDRGTH